MKNRNKNAVGDFLEFFGYFPATPEAINYDRQEYCALLAKCVEDKTDYTIEKYGTIPKERGISTILID